MTAKRPKVFLNFIQRVGDEIKVVVHGKNPVGAHLPEQPVSSPGYAVVFVKLHHAAGIWHDLHSRADHFFFLRVGTVVADKEFSAKIW